MVSAFQQCIVARAKQKPAIQRRDANDEVRVTSHQIIEAMLRRRDALHPVHLAQEMLDLFEFSLYNLIVSGLELRGERVVSKGAHAGQRDRQYQCKEEPKPPRQ